MDLELTDYDQVDEVKLMLDNREQTCHEGSTSRFLVTLSSCSDQGSVEEATSDSDFVFLPLPPQIPNQGSQDQYQQQQQQQRHQFSDESNVERKHHHHHHSDLAEIGAKYRRNNQTNKDLSKGSVFTNPLLAINRGQNQGNNPFGNAPQSPPIDPMDNCTTVSRKQRYNDLAFECIPGSIKPIGLLELSPAIANSKMAELMQQIVTRSDSIFIAIPCNYCFEPVICPPADISNWLNHMSVQHNCKVCPICEKLVGLGPTRDLEIMRKHVVEDLDENWLEKRASRVTFTFGLQQQWFAGNQCNIRESRCK